MSALFARKKFSTIECLVRGCQKEAEIVVDLRALSTLGVLDKKEDVLLQSAPLCPEHAQALYGEGGISASCVVESERPTTVPGRGLFRNLRLRADAITETLRALYQSWVDEKVEPVVGVSTLSDVITVLSYLKLEHYMMEMVLRDIDIWLDKSGMSSSSDEVAELHKRLRSILVPPSALDFDAEDEDVVYITLDDVLFEDEDEDSENAI